MNTRRSATKQEIGWVLGRVTLAGLVLLTPPGLASAQEFRGYVGGGVSYSSWAVDDVHGGSPSSSFGNVSPDTKVVGAIGEGGAFFRRRVALGVELGLPFQRQQILQDFPYRRLERMVRYREQTVFVVVRGHWPEHGRFRAGVVGGAGVVFGSAAVRIAEDLPGSAVRGPFGPEFVETSTTFGYSGGAELAIEATPRVSIVSPFRVLVTPRGDPRGSFLATLGLPAASYRLGIGVRAAF
jgi:hypothetical protein